MSTNWLDKLSDYTPYLPPSTERSTSSVNSKKRAADTVDTSTSLTSRFSFFSLSLFRTSNPASKLDAIDALALIPSPSAEQILSAVGGLREYIEHLKKVHGGAAGRGVGVGQGKEAEVAEAQGQVKDALLAVISAIARATYTPINADVASPRDRQDDNGGRVAKLMQPTLNASFSLYTSLPPTSRHANALTREILGTLFDPTVYTPHLSLLLSQPREIIQQLRSAARISHLKAPASTAAKNSGAALHLTPAELAHAYEACVKTRIAWLECLAVNLISREDIGLAARPKSSAVVGGEANNRGNAKSREKPENKAALKRAEQAAAKAEQDKKDRVARLVIEVRLVQAELAAAMTTAGIEDVRRRAGVYDVPLAVAASTSKVVTDGETGGPTGEADSRGGSPKATERSKLRGSLKRSRRESSYSSSEDEYMQDDEDEDDEGHARHGSSTARANSSPSSGADVDLQIREAEAEEALARGTSIIADSPAHIDGAHRWEDDVESALIVALTYAAKLVQQKRLDVLVGKVERADWLDDDALPLQRGAARALAKPTACGAGAGAGRVGGVVVRSVDKRAGAHEASAQLATESDDVTDPEDKGRGSASAFGHDSHSNSDPDSDQDDESTDSDSEEEEEEEDDLSHPCPLRTLFRLHDQYQEQRLGIWDRLPVFNSSGQRRGSQREYMRGTRGWVGRAWEGLGRALMGVLKYDQLEAYGLERDMYDEWVDLCREEAAGARKGKSKTRPGQARKKSRPSAV